MSPFLKGETMKTLIKNGKIITSVNEYIAGESSLC